jgi:hypothetical protein
MKRQSFVGREGFLRPFFVPRRLVPARGFASGVRAAARVGFVACEDVLMSFGGRSPNVMII